MLGVPAVGIHSRHVKRNEQCPAGLRTVDSLDGRFVRLRDGQRFSRHEALCNEVGLLRVLLFRPPLLDCRLLMDVACRPQDLEHAETSGGKVIQLALVIECLRG